MRRQDQRCYFCGKYIDTEECWHDRVPRHGDIYEVEWFCSEECSDSAQATVTQGSINQ